MVLVYYTLLDKQIPAAQIDAWLDELPTARQARIRHQRQPQRQASSLVGLRLLKRTTQALQLSTFRLRDLHFPSEGKPCWQSPLDFNISHSGRLVICAATLSCQVGVDVEQVRDYQPAVAQRVLNEPELQRIEHDPQAFFALWTAKEAVVKACGHGLAALRKVHTLGDSAVLNGDTWHLIELRIAQGYYGHLAMDKQNMPVVLERLTIDSLCENTG